MIKTIKKVIMVVPVLITNCQVSEKPNKGPVIPQMITTNKAMLKARGEPVALVTLFDIFWNRAESLLFLFFFRIKNPFKKMQESGDPKQKRGV
jgi:hypothetical protein